MIFEGPNEDHPEKRYLPLTPPQHARRRRRRSTIRIDVGAFFPVAAAAAAAATASSASQRSLILRGACIARNHVHDSNAPPAVRMDEPKIASLSWTGVDGPGRGRTTATGRIDRWTLQSHSHSTPLQLHRLHTTCRLLVSHVLSQLPTSPPSLLLLLLPLPLLLLRSKTALMMVVIFSDDSEQLVEGKEGQREHLAEEE